MIENTSFRNMIREKMLFTYQRKNIKMLSGKNLAATSKEQL